MTIFKKLNMFSELEDEVKFYSRECYLKERRIEKLKKEIKELKKQIGGNKNEKKSKGKSTRVLNK